MKRIAIITEADENTTNYGNILQAYALNSYLNEIDDCEATTLLVNSIVYKKVTSHNPIMIIEKILKKLKNRNKSNIYINQQRSANFKKFFEKIVTKKVNSVEELNNTKNDIYIVGSDIVWIQNKGVINRIKFLDFDARKKISYAASFGGDYIPKENIKYIKKCLNDFTAISVREKSSVSLLNSIGVKNVAHVCDPTLLLSKNKWKQNEEKVNISSKYIFVYLLGKDLEQRKKIVEFASNVNLKIVTIPNSNGKESHVDDNFGDYKIDSCSPGEWLYLIDNAEYIFTDSFHGSIFSTIFEKKFFVVKRENELNINNRMLDFLSTIDEENKYIDLKNTIELEKYNWDYKKITKICNDLKTTSKDYLDRYL